MNSQDYASFTAPLAHPGEHLREEYLPGFSLTIEALSDAMKLGDSAYLSQVVTGNSPVTADIALRLAGVFGTSAEFWVNLQAQHDLSREAIRNRAALNAIQPVNRT